MNVKTLPDILSFSSSLGDNSDIYVAGRLYRFAGVIGKKTCLESPMFVFLSAMVLQKVVGLVLATAIGTLLLRKKLSRGLCYGMFGFCNFGGDE